MPDSPGSLPQGETSTHGRTSARKNVSMVFRRACSSCAISDNGGAEAVGLQPVFGPFGSRGVISRREPATRHRACGRCLRSLDPQTPGPCRGREQVRCQRLSRSPREPCGSPRAAVDAPQSLRRCLGRRQDPFPRGMLPQRAAREPPLASSPQRAIAQVQRATPVPACTYGRCPNNGPHLVHRPVGLRYTLYGPLPGGAMVRGRSGARSSRSALSPASCRASRPITPAG